MTSATLERGGTSVTLPLADSASGSPLVSRDIGKPRLRLQGTGALDPRSIDQWSASMQYTLMVRFTDSDAYQDAITLCDLIKSNSDGTPLYLNVDLPEFDTDIMVAPAAAQEQAVNLLYAPGRRDWVEADIALTRVSATEGGGQQTASTPTDTGSGPIRLIGSNGSVSITQGVQVERQVGRPKSVVRAVPGNTATYPKLFDQQKAAYDAFELSFETVENAGPIAGTLVEMFTEPLGRGALTLDFNGLYGMGAVDVLPQGSGALRHQRVSGEEGTSAYPTISLRRVYQD